jgi:hypothetical protein
MAKRNKIIFISILTFLFLAGIVYYWGFVYGFRNFGEPGNWKPINVYVFHARKATAEQTILKTIGENKPFMWLADSNYRFSKDGWLTTFIKTPLDTVEYIYRFKGNDLSWANENESTILLFSIKDKYNDITPTTIKNTDKEIVQEKLLLFESTLINEVKKNIQK